MDIDTSRWSGEGSFTSALLDALQGVEGLRFVRVEDAPASRDGTGFSFLANEIYVGFEMRQAVEPGRILGLFRFDRKVLRKAMSLEELESALARIDAIGPADYQDEGLLQYLRTERIVPPYQTRGYKLVEMVRVYEAA